MPQMKYQATDFLAAISGIRVEVKPNRNPLLNSITLALLPPLLLPS